MISDALDTNLVSAVVGYKLATADFATVTPNLPQMIGVFGEANEANQATLDLTPKQYTSAIEVAGAYGYGSPMYQMARILFPFSGGGTKAPVWFYPQAAAVGATSKKLVVTPTGTATKNGTHTVVLAGREGLDGVFYNINIETGDTPTDISQKIIDAVNAVLGSPATGTLVTTTAVLESKWKGLTAEGMTVSINTNGVDLGVTYAVTSSQSGAGTPSVQAQIDNLGSKWTTIIVNSYGTHTQTMAAFETENGIPDPVNPTGRFAADKFVPFIALTGSVADNDSTVTDARLNEVTISICPAPLSKNFQFEVAASYAILFGNTSSNSPELHILNQNLPDIIAPADGNIGTMAKYINRDTYVKKGNSTVDISAGKYQVKDFVTTYHKLGEPVPQFRYCKDLMLDFNVKYSLALKEEKYLVGKVLANDNDPVSGPNIIKPKQWKAILSEEFFKDLVARGLVADLAFSVASIQCGIGQTNPNRFETAYKYKRTGNGLVISATGTAGFNFGTA